MQKTGSPEISKKPLGRSITLGCLIFILFLCIVIGIASYRITPGWDIGDSDQC